MKTILLLALTLLISHISHASNSTLHTCPTWGPCADCKRSSSPNGFMCPAALALDSNSSSRTPTICPVSSDCGAFGNNSASDPPTNVINSTDYKRGHAIGVLLAKNCHDHAVINGSRLFVNGFLDGYDTMNITKCQDIGFR